MEFVTDIKSNIMETDQPHSSGCAFCGNASSLLTDNELIILGMLQHSELVCLRCYSSRQGEYPSNWMRWLKRNDPEHWFQIVEKHRMGDRPLSSHIRMIRLEI